MGGTWDTGARGDPLGAELRGPHLEDPSKGAPPRCGLLLKGEPDTSSASRQLLYTQPRCEKDSVVKERIKQKMY